MAIMKHQFRIMRDYDDSHHVEVRSFNPRHWVRLTGFPWWGAVAGSYGYSESEARHILELSRRSREVPPVEVGRY